MVDEKGPHYFVAFHSPGPKWVEGTPYNEQPDFGKHVDYISRLHDNGKIVLGGPLWISREAWPASWPTAAWRSSRPPTSKKRPSSDPFYS